MVLQKQQEELFVVPKPMAGAIRAAGDTGSLGSGICGSAGPDKCPLKSRAVIMRHNGRVVPCSADSRYFGSAFPFVFCELLSQCSQI